MRKVTIFSLIVISLTLAFVFLMTTGRFTDTQPEQPEEPKVGNSQVESTEPHKEEDDEEQKPEKIVHSASLRAIGDVLIHKRVYNKAVTGVQQYDFTPMLQHVKTYLENADLTMANQETMIGGSAIGVSTYPRFNSPQEVGTALKEAGVDIVTLANNHTLDRGEQAIMNALDHWNSIGMAYTGAYRSEEDQAEIRIMEANDIRFSFLSFTYGTNGIPVPDGKSYLVNLIDVERIKLEIEQAKKISDVVVLSLHFGNEYERLPNEGQKYLASIAASSGADIIIGHHPHVLQPPEWITQSDGRKTFVIYSLGNFWSGQKGDFKDIGGIIEINVEKVVEGDETTISLKDPSFLATYVDHQYVVHPMYQLEDKKNAYAEIKQHMSRWIPDLEFIEDQP
ncbi:CapA family protein [Pseudalkalibacillus sp. SCS-8]|uniref:CapA family protein n=1 Tax=Pseudalkalibacillus nanhaiensis TaxID=3115291 RepID=UPI0032DBB9F7